MTLGARGCALAMSVALTAAAPGCSFFRANCVNDPQGTCSRSTAFVDYALAGVAVGGGTAAYFAVPCDIDAKDCNQLDALTRIVVPALALGVTALASAVYGDSVVDRCERLQRRARTKRAEGRDVHHHQ